MRNLKRALSLALASVMLLGMMVVGTSASFKDVGPEHNTEAIAVAEMLELMVGNDGKFNPDGTVTREELAGIVTKLMGYDPDDYAGVSNFTDVAPNAWYAPFIEAVRANGIMSGIGDGKFGLGTQVAAYEIGTAICKALGYFQTSGDYGEDYVMAGTRQARKVGLFDNVDSTNHLAPLTRNQIAQVCLNALQATMVDISEDSGAIKVEGDNFSVTVGGAKYDSRYSKEDKYQTFDVEDNTAGAHSIELAEYIYGSKLKKVSDSTEDEFGRTGAEWKYGTESVGPFGKAADEVFVLDKDFAADSTKYDTLEKILQELLDDKKIKLDTDGPAYWLNGKQETPSGDEAIKDAAKIGVVLEVYIDEDETTSEDEIVKVIAYNYKLEQITDVNTDVDEADADEGVSCYVEIGGKKYNDTDIPGFDAKTYVTDAYVAVVVDADDDETIIASYIPKSVEGTVSTKKGSEYLTMDGTRYYAAGAIATGDDYVDLENVKISKDSSYVLYLDENSNILGIVGVEAEATIDDVYYVDVVWSDTGTGSYGDEGDTEYHAQLVALADGTISEVELEVKDHDVSETADNNDLSNATYTDNYDDLRGLLVTLSDKEVGSSKKNDKKFNMELWTDEDFDAYIKGTAGKVSNSTVLKTDSTRMLLASATKSDNKTEADENISIRLNSSTKYLFVEKTKAKLKVTSYTGGVSFDLADAGANLIVVSEAGSPVAQYVVIPCDSAKQKVDYDKNDVLYIASTDDAEDGGDFYLQEVYYADGTKDTVKIDADEYKSEGALESLEAGTFFVYAENSDGYIELDEDISLEISITGTVLWDGDLHTGALTQYVLGSDKDLYEGTLVISNKETDSNIVQDLVVSGAKFIDLHDKDGVSEYTSSIASLSRAADLIKGEKITKAVLDIYVTEDGATVIFLTSAPTA